VGSEGKIDKILRKDELRTLQYNVEVSRKNWVLLTVLSDHWLWQVACCLCNTSFTDSVQQALLWQVACCLCNTSSTDSVEQALLVTSCLPFVQQKYYRQCWASTAWQVAYCWCSTSTRNVGLHKDGVKTVA
jgi:hypothetical protein